MADTDPKPDADPSIRGLAIGLVTSALVALAVRYGLPLDPTLAAEIAGIIVVVGAPLVTSLVIRARAWDPASVIRLRQQMQDMIDEAQSQNPPPVVTGTALTLAAAEALLPHSRASSTTGTEDGLPGRHHQEDR